MTATTQGGRLILEPRSLVLERIRGRFAKVPISTMLADELVQDRREEAQREDAD